MEISKEELLEYIVTTVNDNLHYDNLVDTVNIFGEELDITTPDGKHFSITIDIEETNDEEDTYEDVCGFDKERELERLHKGDE